MLTKKISVAGPLVRECICSRATSREPATVRQAKRKTSSEAQQRMNAKYSWEKLEMMLAANFVPGDLVVTLTFDDDHLPPDRKTAAARLKKFRAELAKLRSRKDAELRMIWTLENKSDAGRWHVHLAINRTQDGDRIISKAWDHGRIMMQLIYDQGKCQRLAAYLTKTPLTDKRLKESHYMASRNLPIPKPKQKIIRWKPFVKIRPPEGWFLDKESYIEGINPVTGYMFREYAYLRSRRD